MKLVFSFASATAATFLFFGCLRWFSLFFAFSRESDGRAASGVELLHALYTYLTAFCCSAITSRTWLSLFWFLWLNKHHFWPRKVEVRKLIIFRFEPFNVILTLCNCTEYVFNVISILGWSQNMFDALASGKLIRVLFINGMIQDIALVSCKDDWGLFSNFVN